MPPRRDLSSEKVQEIRSLRGVLPASEVKKRFGIGSTRLYDIWREPAVEPPTSTDALPAPASETSAGSVLPAAILPPSESVLPAAEPTVSTIQDFYNRLGRLEASVKQTAAMSARLEQTTNTLPAHMEQTTNLLVDILSMLDKDNEEEEIENVEEEQEETHLDIQKVRQILETAQRWTYLSLAAVFLWKVVYKTWKHSKSVHTPTEKVETPKTKRGDPFIMQ